jgi:TonB family protein
MLPAIALAQTSEIQDGLLVRVTLGASTIVRRTPLRYPRQAMAERVQGVVTVKADVDREGRVRSATALSGPELLRAAAVEAVGQWQFVAGPAEQQVNIEYSIPHELPVIQKTPGPRKPLAGRKVRDIMFLGIPESDRPEVLKRVAIQAGDVLANDAMDRAEENLRKLDPGIQFKVLSIGDDLAQIILFKVTAKR